MQTKVRPAGSLLSQPGDRLLFLHFSYFGLGCFHENHRTFVKHWKVSVFGSLAQYKMGCHVSNCGGVWVATSTKDLNSNLPIYREKVQVTVLLNVTVFG